MIETFPFDIYANVVSNNRPNDVTHVVSTTSVSRIDSITVDEDNGDLVMRGFDASLDPFELRAPFGTSFQVYH